MAHVDKAFALALLVFGGSALAGCRKEPVPAPVAAEPSAATTAEQEPSARPAASEFHEPLFDLTMKPVGAVTAGQPATVEITVAAKAGYHPNDKYPYKFKPAAAQGLAYASPTFSREAVKLEPHQATMTVGYTPDGKGDRTIAGLFAFSLCSADQCLIEKRDLALKVTAN